MDSSHNLDTNASYIGEDTPKLRRSKRLATIKCNSTSDGGSSSGGSTFKKPLPSDLLKTPFHLSDLMQLYYTSSVDPPYIFGCHHCQRDWPCFKSLRGCVKRCFLRKMKEAKASSIGKRKRRLKNMYMIKCYSTSATPFSYGRPPDIQEFHYSSKTKWCPNIHGIPDDEDYSCYHCLRQWDNSWTAKMCAKSCFYHEISGIKKITTPYQTGASDSIEAEQHLRESTGSNFKPHDCSTLMTLLECGAEISEMNDKCETPLQVVVDADCPFQLKLLAKCGTDMNLRDSDGCSPLYYAARRKKYKAFFALRELGVFLNEADSAAAVATGDVELLDFLRKHCADGLKLLFENAMSDLHLATLKLNMNLVSWLLDCGLDINAKGWFDRTPLHYAAYEKSTNYGTLVQPLLSRGADIEARDRRGNTALHYAAIVGKDFTVYTLLNAGMNANVRNSHYKTPLHYASYYGHLHVMRVLIAHGGNLNCRTRDNVTPLVSKYL